MSESKSAYTDSNSPYLWDLVYTLEFAWFCTHVLLITFGLASIVYWQTPLVSDVLYRVAFAANVAGLLLILYQKYWRANRGTVALLADDSMQFLVFSAFCLITPRRVLALLPFIVSSFFVCLTYARSYVLPAIGHTHESPLSTRLRDFVYAYNEPLTMLAAYCELLLAFQLFFLAFTPSMQGWAKLILYLTYFRLRYDSSVYVRRAVTNTEVRADRLFGAEAVPLVVRSAWLRFKALVRKGLSPVRQAAAAVVDSQPSERKSQ